MTDTQYRPIHEVFLPVAQRVAFLVRGRGVYRFTNIKVDEPFAAYSYPQDDGTTRLLYRRTFEHDGDVELYVAAGDAANLQFGAEHILKSENLPSVSEEVDARKHSEDVDVNFRDLFGKSESSEHTDSGGASVKVSVESPSRISRASRSSRRASRPRRTPNFPRPRGPKPRRNRKARKVRSLTPGRARGSRKPGNARTARSRSRRMGGSSCRECRSVSTPAASSWAATMATGMPSRTCWMPRAVTLPAISRWVTRSGIETHRPSSGLEGRPVPSGLPCAA